MRNFETARSGEANLFHRLAGKFEPCAEEGRMGWYSSKEPVRLLEERCLFSF